MKTIKILFADDDLKYSMLLKRFLEAEGYEVTYAGNGNIALQQFPLIRPDLDNLTPYLYPQECGNRTHVRELSVAGENTKLRIKGEDFEFSALHYTPYELENARHKDELPNVYQTVLCINEKQMGIAGDDTWGAKTHDEFLLDKEKHHLRFSFKGKL